nr:MAG TPA: hypothetical protein [Caudoviricetes sp.]
MKGSQKVTNVIDWLPFLFYDSDHDEHERSS